MQRTADGKFIPTTPRGEEPERPTTEPLCRYPWTRDVARRQVIGYMKAPHLAGRWQTEAPKPFPTCIQESFAYAHVEARSWLAYHDFDWLQQFDRGEIAKDYDPFLKRL